MWQKAGGGITNNLLDENESMISDTDEVNRRMKIFFENTHIAPTQYRLTKRKWTGLPLLEEDKIIQIMKI